MTAASDSSSKMKDMMKMRNSEIQQLVQTKIHRKDSKRKEDQLLAHKAEGFPTP